VKRNDIELPISEEYRRSALGSEAESPVLTSAIVSNVAHNISTSHSKLYNTDTVNEISEKL
jgi:hypothetical protein